MILEMNPLITQDEITRVIGGGLKMIRYIRTTTPTDCASDVGLDDNEEQICSVELSVRAKRGFLTWPDWLKDIVTGKVSAGKLIEIADVEYEDVKLQISKDGQMRTLSVHELEKVKMAIDVSGDINLDPATGHPTFESIDKAARKLLPEIRTELGWTDGK